MGTESKKSPAAFCLCLASDLMLSIDHASLQYTDCSVSCVSAWSCFAEEKGSDDTGWFSSFPDLNARSYRSDSVYGRTAQPNTDTDWFLLMSLLRSGMRRDKWCHIIIASKIVHTLLLFKNKFWCDFGFFFLNPTCHQINFNSAQKILQTYQKSPVSLVNRQYS